MSTNILNALTQQKKGRGKNIKQMAELPAQKVRFQLKLVENIKYHFLDINEEMGQSMGWIPGFWHNLRDIHGIVEEKGTRGTTYCETLKKHFESEEEYNKHVKVLPLRELKTHLHCKFRRERLSEHSELRGSKIIMLHEVARQKLALNSKTMKRLLSPQDRLNSVVGIK